MTSIEQTKRVVTPHRIPGGGRCVRAGPRRCDKRGRQTTAKGAVRPGADISERPLQRVGFPVADLADMGKCRPGAGSHCDRFSCTNGTWLVGCILISIGGILVPVAYFAGAYGAFNEDVLYGLLYITIPLYTAYYLVTRWEDLWIWITCATVGTGLVLIGTEMVRWAGAAV